LISPFSRVPFRVKGRERGIFVTLAENESSQIGTKFEALVKQSQARSAVG